LCHLLKAYLPASVIINVAVTPINLITVIPFINFGHYILQKEMPQIDSLMDDLKTALVPTIEKYFKSLLCGVIGWVFISPFLLCIVYFITLKLAKIFMKKKHTK
jgi:uncharacterized protein (DUF2062 family)